MSNFEDELKWWSPVSRCNIACGSYGDEQWQVWSDDGQYVEYNDHREIVNIYVNEVNRLKKELESLSTVKC